MMKSSKRSVIMLHELGMGRGKESNSSCLWGTDMSFWCKYQKEMGVTGEVHVNY
jgi:hypothetical protein